MNVLLTADEDGLGLFEDLDDLDDLFIEQPDIEDIDEGEPTLGQGLRNGYNIINSGSFSHFFYYDKSQNGKRYWLANLKKTKVGKFNWNYL